MNARVVAIIFTAAMAALLEILDSSIVNVAIPTMMGNIGATLDEISWVTTGYMIANSIVLPIAAWLGSRLGRRQYFTVAILVFTIASFACGIAPNLIALIIFRVIQGLAGGALLPTSQTLIQEQFPREKAGFAMAIFGMCVMIGPALGPTLGGYLTDNFGWRSIFNVNVPLGLLAATLSWLNVEDANYQKKPTHGIDWWGLIFLCIGVGCFQYILERGEHDGWWDAGNIRACAVFAVLGIGSFIYWELKIPNPIMNLRLFKHNVVRSGTLLMLMLGILLYSLTFVVPIFAARVMSQMSATETGELFIPGSFATMLIMMPVGQACAKVNPKALVLIGLFLSEVSVYWMSQLTTSAGSYDVYFPLIIRGLALPFLFVPINQMVLGSFRGEELGQVAGMQNFFRQIGGSIGISSLDTLLTRFSAQHFNDMLARVTQLSPAGNNAFMGSEAMIYSKMSTQLGMSTGQSIATQNLFYRVGQQVFILSFRDICFTIMVIVAMGLIPLGLIKYTRGTAPAPLDAH